MYKTCVPDIRGGALLSGAPAVWHEHPDIRHGTGHHAMADRNFFIAVAASKAGDGIIGTVFRYQAESCSETGGFCRKIPDSPE